MAKNKILVRIENLRDSFDLTNGSKKQSLYKPIDIMKFATDFYKNANMKDLPCTITIAEVSPSGVALRKRHEWKAEDKSASTAGSEPKDEKDERVLGP